MAEFLENLWNSIFTPGPTPSLLIATNAAFGTLQLLLFILLIATRSWHFVALSTICAGLWWAINWFAREVALERAAQEARDKQKREQEAALKGGQDEGEDAGDDTETETETEFRVPPRPRRESAGQAAGLMQSGRVESSVSLSTEGSDAELVQNPAHGGGAVATGAQQFLAPGAPQLVKRKGEQDGGDLSTDSEWEKVDQDRTSAQ